MKKIKGTNLGNWLVLERWMQEDIFRKTDAPDETWLYRKGDLPEIEKEITRHRETYVTEEDFRNIAEHGLNMVRIPVPYFVFGDVPPYVGCVTYLDRAFSWAEKYGLQILVDLHTAPGGQNGYDNGGITGVCKWCRQQSCICFQIKFFQESHRDMSGSLCLFFVHRCISGRRCQIHQETDRFIQYLDPKQALLFPIALCKPF